MHPVYPIEQMYFSQNSKQEVVVSAAYQISSDYDQ